MNDDIDDRMEAQEAEYEMGIDREHEDAQRIGELEAELTAARSQIAALTTERDEAREQAERLEGALKPEHKCKCIARIHNMAPGRDWWLGELTEKVAEWPHETHCLHIKTPLKDVVFLCNM